MLYCYNVPFNVLDNVENLENIFTSCLNKLNIFDAFRLKCGEGKFSFSSKLRRKLFITETELL